LAVVDFIVTKESSQSAAEFYRDFARHGWGRKIQVSAATVIRLNFLAVAGDSARLKPVAVLNA
jgi:hypothetical protein